MGRAEDVARKIRIELEMRGLHKEPLGIDVVEPPVLFALQREGITVVDGQSGRPASQSKNAASAASVRRRVSTACGDAGP